jgi:hypothetical protein
VYFMEFEFISPPPPSPVLGYKMSKLSGNPFVSHGRTQDTMTMTMTMTMTYDILAIIGVNKVWGGQSPSPIILFESENRIIRR